MVNIDRHQAIWRAFSACKIKWIYGCTVKQLSHPYTLANGFVKHKITVKVSHSHGAGKIGVCDLFKRVRGFVKNVTRAVASKKDLRAVVSNGHGAAAGYVANFDWRGRQTGHLVHLSARNNVEVCAISLMRP